MKQKLFSLLTLLLVVCSSAWGVDDPTLSIGATTQTTSTFLTTYATEGITISSTASWSSGAVQLGNTPSDYNSHYLQIAAGTSISKVSILMSGNGSNKTLQAPAFGWKNTPSSNQADTYYLPDSQTSTANSYAGALWFDYDFSEYDIQYLRVYRQTKYVSSTDPEYTGSSTGLGNGNTIKIWGIKVWLKAAAPTITAQTIADASYVIGTAAGDVTALSVTATASAGELSYQWYKNTANSTTTPTPTAIDGATSSSYKPLTTADEEGDLYYFCKVTDSNGSVYSNIAKITVSAAAAPTISIAASATDVTAGTSITLTATADGVPTPTIKWYCDGVEVPGETDATYTFDAIVGSKVYTAKAFNSEAPSGVTSNEVTINAAARTGYTLNQVVYSNSFDAFIIAPVGEGHGTITAYYLAGTSAPTISSVNMSDGATYNLEGTELTVTAEDGVHSAVYDVTVEAVTPYAEDGVFFNGTEGWVKTGNSFSSASGKEGWVFSKNDNDWNRETPGKNRIYLFLAASTKITLTSGGSNRNIKVYRNGVKLDSPTSTGAADATQDIAGDSENAYMIAIVSNQTSGDGAIKAISVTDAQTTVTSVNITPGKEYITYVPTHDLDFTTAAELTAYIATAATASTVTMVSVDKVPAGTPIVIKATAIGSPIAVSKAASTDDVSGNKLKIGDGFTSIGGDGKYDYILSNGKFYHASAGVLPAGKCYLHLDAAPEANELTMDFGEGDVTSISGIEKMRNAENETFFNLAGQRVAQPTKGLYITNGKKVIVK